MSEARMIAALMAEARRRDIELTRERHGAARALRLPVADELLAELRQQQMGDRWLSELQFALDHEILKRRVAVTRNREVGR